MEATPDRKRILLVITKASWGGAQRYVYEMATAAQEKGCVVTVAYGTDGLLVERLTAKGIRTLPLPYLSWDVVLRNELRAFKSLIALLKEERPDVVHVNSSKAGLTVLAARIARVPRILFTAHGWAFNERRPWWQLPLIYGAYALTLWLSHRTICVSEAVRRDMFWLPGNKMVTILLGIDPPPFLSREEARVALVPGIEAAYLVGMITELHPTKRVEDAIDAVAELAKRRPDLVLVVLGGGELESWLTERIAYWKLSDRVFLKGFTPDAAIYLKAFDLFIMPSRTEAFGIAALEAGFAGLPVIASRVGGLPKIVRHKTTGLLVPPENPHALARAMRTLIEHPDEAKKYAEALTTHVTRTFSKETMVNETLALYV